MILIDYSTLSLAAVLQQDALKAVTIDPEMVRYCVYNSIRTNVLKFKREYGDEIVIAMDSRSWRHEAFPYYKKNRKRSESIDWVTIFAALETVQNDIRAFFPYKTLLIDRAEADDIIACVAAFKHHYNITQINYKPTLIIARDDDMSQLLKYNTVKMYSPIDKKFVTNNNPSAALLEKVIRGDKGDGIPNVLSDDDTFMIKGKRQKTLTEKVMNELLTTDFATTSNTKLRLGYNRNKQLIDFDFIPTDLQKEIRRAYVKQSVPGHGLLLAHFQQKNMRHMIEFINDF